MVVNSGRHSHNNNRSGNVEGSEDTQNCSFKKNTSTVPLLEANKGDKNDQQVQKRISEEHRILIEGVKLSMELMESKVSNNIGYIYLVLNKML